ncbi:UDP-N-acetylmuramoyl-L-alanyl-D-glutamate--2,6-diaminopimelate ligase [Alphaproteobacteria bacterium]|nr:UDP-N-acetylmuramoyl-L-alanyl-D-glutamate--2,6-diaminopimelate ligase [Alphaproteobacteria bacterium]
MNEIQTNSKNIKEGDIFIGISCENLKRNVAEAIKNGATLVFVEAKNKNLFKNFGEKLIFIEDSRLISSKLSRFLRSSQPEFCVSVTGTNGKSSIANFVNQIWSLLGEKSANLGTLGLFIGRQKIENCGFNIQNLTTPEPVTLHKILEYLHNEKVSHFVFEASSHALDQKRLHSVKLTAAAFSNIAADHLDYHKTKEDYLTAKLKLFHEILPNDNYAIIYGDSDIILNSIKILHKKTITFGLKDANDIQAFNIMEHTNQLSFDLKFFGKIFKNLTLNLVGEFQILNVLCAMGLCYSCGANIENIAKILIKIDALNGRMEHILGFNGGEVFVDYAHTAEGMKTALLCFRQICKSRLICVFGCGGDRDKSKRMEMGRIADEFADIIIVTDDNPRSEDPATIRKEIVKNCKKTIEISDRKEAIARGMKCLESGDFLIVFGKGHETTQIYANKITSHNDKEAIMKIGREERI